MAMYGLLPEYNIVLLMADWAGYCTLAVAWCKHTLQIYITGGCALGGNYQPHQNLHIVRTLSNTSRFKVNVQTNVNLMETVKNST